MQQQCMPAYRTYRVVHAISSSVCGEVGGDYSQDLDRGEGRECRILALAVGPSHEDMQIVGEQNYRKISLECSEVLSVAACVQAKAISGRLVGCNVF
jgi:hypothetical protein